MRWTKSNKRPDGTLSVPDNWLFPHYYDALNTLFRIENGLRTFVYVVLKNQHRSTWRELTIPTEEGSNSTISAIAKKRFSRDRRFGYLGYALNSPLAHLTSGELIGTILADAYWPLFAPHFPTAKEIVRLKLEEIGNVRNALAHFRPINPDDVEVVKQNANQVLSGVESLLRQVVLTPQDVPTNTTEPWYAAFESLNTNTLPVDLYQSDDEQWLRVQLTYHCQKTGAPYKSEKYHHLRLLTTSAVNLLRGAPSISDCAVFAYDYPMHWGASTPSKLHEFTTELNFTFGRTTFESCFSKLIDDFEEAIRQIIKETALIADDNLVRGRYVRIGSATINLHNGAGWIADTSGMLVPSRNDDPAEFWGTKPFWGDDLLTDTHIYPWMRIEVAEEGLPF